MLGVGSWGEGDEPMVAGELISIFSKLEDANLFVTTLTSTVIDITQELRHFKKKLPTPHAPYLLPLTVFLNKHPEACAEYFLPFMGTIIYSEMLEAVLRLEEAKDIRAYLSGEEGTKMLLTSLFGVPLHLATLPEPDDKTVDLARHAVGSEPSWGVELKEETAAVAKLTEARNVAVQKLRLAEADCKRAAFSKAALLSSASDSPGSELNAKLSSMEAKHQSALTSLAAAEEEAKKAREMLQAEVGKSEIAVAAAKAFGPDQQPAMATYMSGNDLECQHQGLRVFSVLMSFDSTYVEGDKHASVVNAMKTLWRSRGRSLRLEKESMLLQKYQLESKMLATFLVRYASAHPEDIELLFELLQIFLRPTVIDFSFVKSFFVEAVEKNMSSVHKKALLHRFFTLLTAKDEGEELKVNAMQLLVLPMLKSTLESEKVSAGLGGMQVNPNDKDGAAKTGGAQLGKEGVMNLSEVVDADVIKVFMRDALDTSRRGGSDGTDKSGHCERLNIELLKLSTLLIEFMGRELVEHRKELIKFAWNHLKSEDNTSKQWAYVNVCRFISVYETPSKIILQVYVALLRTFQVESKEVSEVKATKCPPAFY